MLTVKEERFAQLLAIADISQTAAYIDAGYSRTQLRKTIWESASRLAATPKVVARVNEIRATARDNAAMTLEKHLAPSGMELERTGRWIATGPSH